MSLRLSLEPHCFLTPPPHDDHHHHSPCLCGVTHSAFTLACPTSVHVQCPSWPGHLHESILVSGLHHMQYYSNTDETIKAKSARFCSSFLQYSLLPHLPICILPLRTSTHAHACTDKCARTDARTHTHTTLVLVVLFFALCVCCYLKYCWYRLPMSCLPFIWHFLSIMTHTHTHTHTNCIFLFFSFEGKLNLQTGSDFVFPLRFVLRHTDMVWLDTSDKLHCLRNIKKHEPHMHQRARR